MSQKPLLTGNGQHRAYPHSHGHGKGMSEYEEETGCSGRRHCLRFTFILSMSFGYSMSLLVAGILAHSLALVCESFHAMSDCIAYVINIWVFYQEKAMQRRPYQTAYPFAWRRAVVIGGFFSAVFLLSAAMFMLIQGFQRVFLFADVHEVNSYLVTVLGITGLSFNALSVLLMCAGFEAHGHSHGPPARSESGRSPLDMNLYGMLLHFAVDVFSSSLILVSGCLERYTNYQWRYLCDPIASFMIVALIVCLAIPLLRDSMRVLMQTPHPALDVEELRKEIADVPRRLGVEATLKADAQGVQVWRLDEHSSVGSVRLRCRLSRLDEQQSAVMAQHAAMVEAVHEILSSDRYHCIPEYSHVEILYGSDQQQNGGAVQQRHAHAHNGRGQGHAHAHAHGPYGPQTNAHAHAHRVQQHQHEHEHEQDHGDDDHEHEQDEDIDQQTEAEDV